MTPSFVQIPSQSAQRQSAGTARLWGPLVLVLYVTVATFYAANSFSRELNAILGIAKWGLLAALGGLAFYSFQNSATARRNIDFFPVIFICFAIFLSIPGSEDIERSLLLLASNVIALFTASITARLLTSMALKRHFFSIIANVGRMIILSSAIAFVLGLNLGRISTYRFSGWTDNPNTLALLLVPGLTIMVAGVIERQSQWQLRHAMFLLAGLFLLYKTDSRAGILWIGISSFIYFSLRRGNAIIILGGFIAIVIFLNWWDDIRIFVTEIFRREGDPFLNLPTGDVLSGRSEFWQIAYRLIPEQPIFGHGIGASEQLLAEYDWMVTEAQGGHFHNSYLTILVETGFVGFGAVMLVVLVAVLRGLGRIPQIRRLPRTEWPTEAIPLAMIGGALAYSMFETWLLNAGNANMFLFWTLIWITMAQGGAARRAEGFNWVRVGARP